MSGLLLGFLVVKTSERTFGVCREPDPSLLPIPDDGVPDLLVHRLEQSSSGAPVCVRMRISAGMPDTNCRSPGMEILSERHDPPS